MKVFNRYSALSVGLSIVVLLGGMVAEAHSFHGRSGGSVMGHLLKGVDLTAQQKEQVKVIMQAHRGDLLAGRVAVLQARQNLVTVTTDGTFDPNAVQAAYSTLAAAQENMTALRAQIFTQVMPVLTPDQQTVVKDRIAKVNQRMQRTIARLQSKLSSPPSGNR
jgi:Spy/CpxP family protein refolding chaperone